MRISGGDFKGRKISSKKALGLVSKHGILRPTSSKVRESIFNIIGGDIRDSIFVDLYAGTGAVGIEAMSRGARMVFFVETDRKRALLIEKTLSDCGCIPRARIINQKAYDFISRAKEDGLKFDIIFLDPSYYSAELEDALFLLSGGELLSEQGVVIAEHSFKTKLPDKIGALKQKKAYKYGDTMLTLFKTEGG
ncbi:MAG: 16S rRNA (guanine(966)-N(2))-methyltransferase RsmD [Nitrospirae bacterium]|nr:16S rRNA (guanine(966)-N(2))-methyltransferase RsmD [Nitrospirota bacterium]